MSNIQVAADSETPQADDLRNRLVDLVETLRELLEGLTQLEPRLKGWTLVFDDRRRLVSGARHDVLRPEYEDATNYYPERRLWLMDNEPIPQSHFRIGELESNSSEQQSRGDSNGVIASLLVAPVTHGSAEWERARSVQKAQWDTFEVANRPASDDRRSSTEKREDPGGHRGVPPAVQSHLDCQRASSILKLSRLADTVGACCRLVDSLRDQASDAGKAARMLPAEVQEVLDGFHGRKWTPYLLRKVLRPTEVWREVETGERVELPKSEFELARGLIEGNPCPRWTTHLPTIEAAIEDLRFAMCQVDRGGLGQEVDGCEVPAEYRDGGKKDGEVLTAKYVCLPETYGLSSSTLTRRLGDRRKKIPGLRGYVYEFEAIAALSASLHRDS